jgi:glycosyltransferase involved in cell wall biosynthesis
MYTSLRDEYEAKWRGVRLSDGWPATIRAARDLAWFAAVVARYEREAVRGSGRILVNYESVRKRLAAEYGARLPFRKIPYTSDSAFRPERALDCPSPGESPPRIPEGDGPLLLALSRHDPRKGVDVLLRALRILQTRDVPFRACLLGGGVILESHRRLVRSLGLESVVEITGFVADSAPYLRRAAVFVLPSLQEGSGSLSLIEAMQAGLPAVASDLDGIPEDTGTGRGALLVPPGDEHALAGALETLLRDEELRRRMANEAKGAFQSQFTADRLVEALGKIYTDDRAGVPTRRE